MGKDSPFVGDHSAVLVDFNVGDNLVIGEELLDVVVVEASEDAFELLEYKFVGHSVDAFDNFMQRAFYFILK